MQTKTKTIVAVFVIFILTGLVMGFYLQQKNKVAKNAAQTQVVQQNQTQSQPENNQIQPKTIAVTQVSTGTIASIDKNNIVVKTENDNLNLSIQSQTSVYSMVKSAPVQKSITDLKVDSSIAVEFDTATNDILAIKLMQ